MKYMFGLERYQWELLKKESVYEAEELIIEKILNRMDILNERKEEAKDGS